MHVAHLQVSTPACLSRLHPLDTLVLALQARLHQTRMAEDQNGAAADQPEKGRDGGSDPQERKT